MYLILFCLSLFALAPTHSSSSNSSVLLQTSLQNSTSMTLNADSFMRYCDASVEEIDQLLYQKSSEPLLNDEQIFFDALSFISLQKTMLDKMTPSSFERGFQFDDFKGPLWPLKDYHRPIMQSFQSFQTYLTQTKQCLIQHLTLKQRETLGALFQKTTFLFRVFHFPFSKDEITQQSVSLWKPLETILEELTMEFPDLYVLFLHLPLDAFHYFFDSTELDTYRHHLTQNFPLKIREIRLIYIFRKLLTLDKRGLTFNELQLIVQRINSFRPDLTSLIAKEAQFSDSYATIVSTFMHRKFDYSFFYLHRDLEFAHKLYLKYPLLDSNYQVISIDSNHILSLTILHNGQLKSVPLILPHHFNLLTIHQISVHYRHNLSLISSLLKKHFSDSYNLHDSWIINTLLSFLVTFNQAQTIAHFQHAVFELNQQSFLEIKPLIRHLIRYIKTPCPLVDDKALSDQWNSLCSLLKIPLSRWENFIFDQLSRFIFREGGLYTRFTFQNNDLYFLPEEGAPWVSVFANFPPPLSWSVDKQTLKRPDSPSILRTASSPAHLHSQQTPSPILHQSPIYSRMVSSPARPQSDAPLLTPYFNEDFPLNFSLDDPDGDFIFNLKENIRKSPDCKKKRQCLSFLSFLESALLLYHRYHSSKAFQNNVVSGWISITKNTNQFYPSALLKRLEDLSQKGRVTFQAKEILTFLLSQQVSPDEFFTFQAISSHFKALVSLFNRSSTEHSWPENWIKNTENWIKNLQGVCERAKEKMDPFQRRIQAQQSADRPYPISFASFPSPSHYCPLTLSASSGSLLLASNQVQTESSSVGLIEKRCSSDDLQRSFLSQKEPTLLPFLKDLVSLNEFVQISLQMTHPTLSPTDFSVPPYWYNLEKDALAFTLYSYAKSHGQSACLSNWNRLLPYLSNDSFFLDNVLKQALRYMEKEKPLVALQEDVKEAVQPELIFPLLHSIHACENELISVLQST